MEKRIPAKTIALCLFALLACAGNSLGELLAYDGFAVPNPYASRKSLHGISGGTGFAGPWVVDTSESASNVRRYVASKTSRMYPDTKGRSLQVQAGSMTAEARGEGSGALSRELANEISGTVWISFLTRMNEQVGYGWDIQFTDASNETQVKLMNGRAEQNRWRIQSPKTNTGKPKDGLFKSKVGMTPVDATLVILKIDNMGSGEADGKVMAYLNPVDLRDPELSAMASLQISGLQLNAIKKILFAKKSLAEGYLDEIRIGTTLDDVLPWQ